MAGGGRRPSARRLHEAAWPDLFANLQSAYADLTQTRFELERRAAEVEEARDLFQQVVESMSEGLFLLDRAGQVVQTNPAARALLERDESELVGQPFAEVCGAAALPTTPWQLLERSPSGTLTNLETECRGRNGRGTPISVSYGLVRDKRGKIIGMLAVARDMTERKRAEDALRFLADASAILASSLDYEATLASVAHLAVPRIADWCAVDVLAEDGAIQRLAVAHTDPARVELVAELERRYPPDPDAPTGVPSVLRTGRPELYPEIPEALLEAVARDAEHLRLIHELGLTSAMVVPLLARGGVLGALTFAAAESGRRFGSRDLALAEDLARRASMAIDNARLYRQAQDAIRIREDFLSIASHELRTPVAALLANLQLLLRTARRSSPPPDPRLVERAERSEQQARRLTQLIAGLLDVSLIGAGRLELDLAPIDLAEMVREVVERHREELEQQGCALEPRLATAVGQWDRPRLEQVVTNLLTNAMKYGSGRPIVVGVEATPEMARLVVQDHGIGIAPEHQGRIFERFERAVSAQNYGGLGLGLYITRQIVEAHGGRIGLVSEPGVGTTFTVELPRQASLPAYHVARQVD